MTVANIHVARGPGTDINADMLTMLIFTTSYCYTIIQMSKLGTGVKQHMHSKHVSFHFYALGSFPAPRRRAL